MMLSVQYMVLTMSVCARVYAWVRVCVHNCDCLHFKCKRHMYNCNVIPAHSNTSNLVHLMTTSVYVHWITIKIFRQAPDSSHNNLLSCSQLCVQSKPTAIIIHHMQCSDAQFIKRVLLVLTRIYTTDYSTHSLKQR